MLKSKYFLPLLLFILTLQSGFSQTFYLSGYVSDQFFNYIPGVEITVWSDSGLTNQIQTVNTNVNGDFTLSLNFNTFPDSSLYVEMTDCDSSKILNTLSINASTDTVFTSFLYCASANCSGSLSINQFQTLSINVSLIDSFAGNYSYDWDMGDGTVFNGSPNSSFNYTYLSPGTYPVCVTANSTSCTYSICDSVTLLPPPDSITVYGFVEDTSGNRISNAGISIKNDSTSPWSYVSGTATDSSGDYSLKVADNAFPNGYVIVQFNDCNYSSTFDSIVSIHPLVPSGDSIESNFDQYCANVNCGGNLFSNVNFTTANFNLIHNVNNLGYSYIWDFGDGTGPLSGGKIISHQYNSTGIYNVCVTAVSQYCTYTICDSIQINTLPPSANFTVYGQVLDSSGNSVSNHQVFFYQDSSSLIWQSFQSTFTDSFGFYSQVLPVDSFGSYVIISMYSPCPDSLTSTESTVPAGDSIESNFQFCQGSQPTCSGSISASVNGLLSSFTAINNISAAYAYSWNFGDGTIISGGQNINHTYASSGSYNVCVTATSALCNYTACDSITITNSFPDTITVFGFVQDSSGNPIQGVNLELLDTTSAPVLQSTSSDSSGYYIFTGLSANFSGALLFVQMQDCNNDTIVQSAFIPAPYDSVQVDFTYCDTAICGGAVISSANGLQASFSAANNLAAAYSYSWDFGDGTIISGGQNINHTYASSGSYNVCVTATSALCTYSACDSITVTSQAPNCTVNYTYQNFSSAISFTGIDSSSSPSSIYSWNFGDGNTSNGISAVHNYQNPGAYTVCLNKIDSINSCSYCDTILVSFDTSALSIGGNISINSASRSGDQVIIYEETNTGSAPHIQPLDTTLNVNGTYVFYGLSPAAYTIKVMPENSSKDPGLMPKYWQNENYWGDASSLIINSNQQGISFNFNNNPNSLTGPGSVIVSVRDSFNQYISNATVWIEDLNQSVLQYDITVQNSNVLFNNLPFGDYKVGTDYPGYYMFKQDVTLSSAMPNDSIGLSLRNGWIATSLKQVSNNPIVNIYPNPLSDKFTLSHNLDEFELLLKNIEGKEIAIEAGYSKTETEVRFKEKPKTGIYILQIISNDRNISKKLFVR